MKAMSIDIDYLHLDNTFASPEFDFPTREVGYNTLKSIINQHEKYRAFLFCYGLGKEEIFINLAEEFETLIVVDEDKMRQIRIMDLKPHLFTTDPT